MARETRKSPMARAYWGLLATIAMLCTGAAQAYVSVESVVKTQGTWYGTNGLNGTLLGRDISGKPVNLLNAAGTAPNPNLAFVYDSQLNLTWLADWNVDSIVSWSHPDSDMNWATAKAWAGGLTYFGGGWSLPSVLDIGGDGCSGIISYAGTECGYNVYSGEAQRRGSPLAHMFYDTLGNKAYFAPTGLSPQAGWGLTNTGPFSQIQRRYWSGTAYAPNPSTLAWCFFVDDGWQGLVVQSGLLYAVAVRPGDVFAGPVPEPQSVVMLLAGLGALALVARRRRTH